MQPGHAWEWGAQHGTTQVARSERPELCPHGLLASHLKAYRGCVTGPNTSSTTPSGVRSSATTTLLCPHGSKQPQGQAAEHVNQIHKVTSMRASAGRNAYLYLHSLTPPINPTAQVSLSLMLPTCPCSHTIQTLPVGMMPLQPVRAQPQPATTHPSASGLLLARPCITTMPSSTLRQVPAGSSASSPVTTTSAPSSGASAGRP